MVQVIDFEGPTAWADFKARLALKQSKIQELSLIGGEYTVFFTENTDLYRVSITQTSADGIDYETNYQPTANQKTDLDVNVQNTVAVGSSSAANYYNSKSVAATTTDTLLIQTPTTEKRIKSILVGGDADGVFTLKINTTTRLTVRNNITRPQVELNLHGLIVNASEVLEIEVYNCRNQSRTFEATVIYEQ